MIKAVVFDWAGTMVDYGSRAPMGAFVTLFAQEGIQISIDQARVPMGTNKWDHINAILHMDEVQSQWVALHKRPHENADVDDLLAKFVPMNKLSIVECSALIPGAAELVATLRQRKIKIGATTGYTHELMDILLPLAQRQGYEPDAYACAGDTPMGRPEPQMMHLLTKSLGVTDPINYIKVDDTLPGIEEGKNFGCWTVGVAVSGNVLGYSLQELEAMPVDEANRLKQEARETMMSEMNPDFVIDSVADLLPVLEAINLKMALREVPKSQ